MKQVVVLQASCASAWIFSVGTPMWYSHSQQTSSPVQSRMAFFTKLPSLLVFSEYSHTSTMFLS